MYQNVSFELDHMSDELLYLNDDESNLCNNTVASTTQNVTSEIPEEERKSSG